MQQKVRRWVGKVRRWLANRPPLMGPESLAVVTEDVRKLGIGAMGAGVLGLFAPSDKIALGDSVALFALGAIIWVTGIMLHALNERSRPDSEE
ncbi:hypothetical protein FIU88_18025 (plasmid) [Halomonas sp. THAF12]|uniref:hypothetical protein n=1 Tax=Halomonas sp. THAF12 TaxID=2587849 RepID=UPI0012697EA3|nr:hypothetical protein [Halomonas sp. THAF12]QFT86848.1 hypothetical protein FIU88_18025 [Halomonas sp. THAF12]